MKAVTSRSLAVLDLHRGAEVAPGRVDGLVDPAIARSVGGDRPSWNASTTCVQTIHHWMSAQGWNGQQLEPELAQYEGEVEELPKRSLDVGVGWWR